MSEWTIEDAKYWPLVALRGVVFGLGIPPEEAWKVAMRSDYAPALRVCLAEMRSSESGRAKLQEAEKVYTENGMRPPWEWDREEKRDNGDEKI